MKKRLMHLMVCGALPGWMFGNRMDAAVKLTHRYLLLVGLLIPGTTMAKSDAEAWHSRDHPDRVRIELPQATASPVTVNIDLDHLVAALNEAAVDSHCIESFAFERVVAINPRTGLTVGRFHLVPDGDELPVDGDFVGLARGDSPWTGFDAQTMSWMNGPGNATPAKAILIRKSSFQNDKLSQPLTLSPEAFYLLQYRFMMDVSDHTLTVMLNEPGQRLFNELPHSYFNKMPAHGKWEMRRVLFRPRKPEAELRITHAFVGLGGVSSICLSPVRWVLRVEPDTPLSELDLYVQTRAGHRLTVPQPPMLSPGFAGPEVSGRVGEASRQDLNAASVRVDAGDMSLWTVDPVLPLKVHTLAGYAPPSPTTDGVAELTVLRGGAGSLVLGLNAARERIDDLTIDCDLPLEIQAHRLGRIPVYDGPTVGGEVKGRLLETRYDAMVPLDYALDPPSPDGLHALVLTLRAEEGIPGGVYEGRVRVSLDQTTLDLPLRVQIPELTVKPSRHFGSMFGAAAYLIARPAGTADMVEDAISIATFHGLSAEDQSPRSVASLSEGSLNLRKLAEKYNHALLDHHLAPRNPATYLDFTYTVTERGEGLAPKLTDWDFSNGFDQAMQDFVIDRDIPWFAVYHTNGHLMHMIRLRNGTTYSVEPNPNDPNWVHLSRKEFDRLIGDYFEAIAQHLDQLGLLDRAMFVIDETGTETYDNVHAYVKAIKARPNARKIKIGHTIQKTATWTRRLPDGSLLMDDTLDVLMPINDETYNFFEPSWNEAFKKEKTQWVYNVETDHMNLQDAGLNTALLPLRLGHFGVDGWYCWESFMWSLPYAYLPGERGSDNYGTGPVGNPWVNPFYHHGPGVLSFFYPPDARGPAPEPTHLVIPSYRLTLMRDGIALRALNEVLQAGKDDDAKPVTVDSARLAEAQEALDSLWPDNPVQWYLDYHTYQRARALLNELAMEGGLR